MATIYVNNAPFIQKNFVVSGAFGEPRTGHVHTGLDLAPVGYRGSLYAIDEFTVIHSAYDASGYGNYFIARSPNNILYLYAHMLGLPPALGTHFNLYDYVGECGNSGPPGTGWHVHLAMQQGTTWTFSNNLSDYIDPTTYLTGINNVVDYSQYYYFDGTPGPTPTPGVKKSKFPWYIYQNTPGL